MRINAPLGIRDDILLDKLMATRLLKIESFDLQFVSRKLLEEARIERDRLPIAIQEFRRFMGLIAFGVSPVAIMGPVVDEVWHQFVLFTPQYRDFCNLVFGQFIDHQPNTPETPVPTVALRNFIDGYRRVFGHIPEIWFAQMDTQMKQYFEVALAGGAYANNAPARWSGWTGKLSQLPKTNEGKLLGGIVRK